jgi:hypothetical protein
VKSTSESVWAFLLQLFMDHQPVRHSTAIGACSLMIEEDKSFCSVL